MTNTFYFNVARTITSITVSPAGTITVWTLPSEVFIGGFIHPREFFKIIEITQKSEFRPSALHHMIAAVATRNITVCLTAAALAIFVTILAVFAREFSWWQNVTPWDDRLHRTNTSGTGFGTLLARSSFIGNLFKSGLAGWGPIRGLWINRGHAKARRKMECTWQQPQY